MASEGDAVGVAVTGGVMGNERQTNTQWTHGQARSKRVQMHPHPS